MQLFAFACAVVLARALLQPIVVEAAANRAPALLDSLSRTYGMPILPVEGELSVRTRHGRITCRAAPAPAVERYVPLFAAEMSLYPPELIRRARLERIVYCTGLAFAGQLRAAIPDFEHDTLYLDVSRGSYDPTYLQRAFHHEFFHVIDYADDGQVYEDASWVRLNPPGFRYGNGGRNAQDRHDSSILTAEFPGFLDYYSTTGVEEDKAEIFSCLLFDPRYVEMRAKADPTLDAKVKRMKELLVEFCPEMDERFWGKVHNRERGLE